VLLVLTLFVVVVVVGICFERRCLRNVADSSMNVSVGETETGDLAREAAHEQAEQTRSGAGGGGGAGGSKKKKSTNILDTPWVAPDINKAVRYADYVQPRRGGKGGDRFTFNNTTTGRHCCLGNLGEQLDLWEEGQISEFGIYGSGVTNYFKFIKWCFWLFLILSIVTIPAVVLNDSGPYSGNTGLSALSRTTVGNLISPFANTTVSLHIPGCNSYGVYDVNCILDKAGLAMFYSYLDIIVLGITFIAFIWLRHFENVEERTLEKNTGLCSLSCSFFVMCGMS
jgi:hypothetical protein